MTSWFDQLQQASLNGVPFAVEGGKARFGRRISLHEYPYRDKPWPEDMGRGTRGFNVTAFVVENDVVFNGGSAIAQRDALIAQAEAPGQKTLVHPTYGKMSVVVMEMAVNEKREEGGVFTIEFIFIEAGKKQFPTTATNTSNATQAACATANSAATTNFVTAVHNLVASGAAVIAQAKQQVSFVMGQVASLAADATSAMHLVASLTTGLSPSLAGMFGRFAGGALTGYNGASPPTLQTSANPDATVATAIALGAAARSAVSSAGASLTNAAAALSSAAPGNYATAAQTYVQSLQSAMVDPADAVRVLTALAQFGPIQPNASPAPWPPAAAMQSAANDVFRRAAVVSLAYASSLYQPSSSNDAYSLMTSVVKLLDAEANIAGDQGADATFNALEALAAAVVTDLMTRGASLPYIQQFTIGASLPSAVIAQRLYRDPSRAGELEAEASAIHPAFMPMSFPVLSS